jgi:hypothetical protein
MHSAIVLEYLDSLCHRGLVTHYRPRLFKVPAILETIAAEVTFSGCLLKWFTALATERFLKQPYILQTCCTIGNSLAASQACGAGQAALREENINEGSPEFCSENLVHANQGIDLHTDKYLPLQRAVSFI